MTRRPRIAWTAGIHPRYAREWLEQQAVAGLLTVTEHGEGGRRFSLPVPHREVLADPENPAYVAPFSLLVAGIGRVLPELVDAYRQGGGVPWEAYGRDARDGWSITCCFPTAMVEQPSVATGTVMRADVLRRYAADAGFSGVEVLAVDNELFRFYRLRP